MSWTDSRWAALELEFIDNPAAFFRRYATAITKADRPRPTSHSLGEMIQFIIRCEEAARIDRPGNLSRQATIRTEQCAV